MWYPGGEATFLWRMAQESTLSKSNIFWFTTLVSKKETLPGLYKSLEKAGAVEVRTINMAQGQKSSRIVAWTFLDAQQQQAWRDKRWGQTRRRSKFAAGLSFPISTPGDCYAHQSTLGGATLFNLL
ncbi:RlmF-related methyltransferase [Hymenobacter qilianensis]|uniref:RlmF-related methyltransferase n=1 Tax=Hymenobacter qilianensis TaxID=1385715 RepID=UPI0021D18CA3|nr:RlmF-related methyltransferase [Hymenobacter qilianensis]